ncbi:DUF2199 domain-containing protein [Myceligenerans pegani]|uniref:DUF2199 domain-containing protein n=1 Tax=Myceligenerans pegani TaxID=2776917 RepID=A0ABR9N489_9MICO|nr:DUF2199 domain-containing protein [Myceligenerans sp. TRM 65318]MBE1878487.1 DUF2199 domain-containing protein [Myceligenerans sp. TRM 65318]MBE3020758.1 DUF2199 domain-containing protein [Myceligenerans sp. TRM 65318]
MTTTNGWACATCGTTHGGLAMVFGPPAPSPWISATDAERAAGELNADTCILHAADGTTHRFVRGHIEIPVHDSPDGPFCWSVWVSLSEENMLKQAEHWDDPDRAGLEPMFAWLSTHLPYEPATAPLPARLHTREPGLTPWIELDPDLDHPLAHEYRHGITMHRVAELNQLLLHG